MSVPKIDNLRLEVWQKLSVGDRLQSLQNLENVLAVQEKREACTVEFIKDDQYKSPESRQTMRGTHLHNHIYINEALVNSDKSYKAIYKGELIEVNPNEPYMAVETLFHESRHAYQEHISIKDSQKYSDFKMNISKEGYLSKNEFGSLYYRWQPIEKDANEIARQRTNELYTGEFNDNNYYPNHQKQMDSEVNDDIELAKLMLGNDYEAKARQEMISNYNKNRSEELNKTDELATSESSEDLDYYYGYSP